MTGTFVFSFFRHRAKTRQEFVAELNRLYRNNKGFARLIGTQVAPAWADGRLIAEVLPEHLPALEWWLAQFWSRNSGMPQDEALLRAKIGQAQLKGRRVSPDRAARKAAKLRTALKGLWSQKAAAPDAKILVNKQDVFAKVTRWQEADEKDLKRIGEWRDDAINLPFRIEEPMDLRPSATNLPTAHELEDLYAEECFVHVDTSGDRSDEEWAHGTPGRNTVNIAGKTLRYEDLPDHADEIITNAVMNQDLGTLEFLNAALESLEEREARQTWGYVNLSDGTGSLTLRVRTWRNTTRQRVGKPIPVLPPEKRKAPEPKRVVEVPVGAWYHSSIAEWERAAKTDKRAAEALAEFHQEQADAKVRRSILDQDDAETAVPDNHEETPETILELLTEDRDERIENGEEIPSWLTRQIAFYTHVVNKAQGESQAAAAPANNQERPAARVLSELQKVVENNRVQLETELELTPGKARRGLVGRLAHLRMLEEKSQS